MTAHSALGASGAKRWMTCAGSFRLCQQAPEAPTSIYAAAGSLAHELAEDVLAARAHSPADAMAKAMLRAGCTEGDNTVPHRGWLIELNEEMADAIEVYLREIERRDVPGATRRHETRVDLSGWFEAPPPVPMFGTADTWIYDPRRKRLTVIDFKFGSGVFISATDNPQLLYYAAGVLLELPLGDVDDVEIVVVQPRAAGMAPVRSSVLATVDLLQWVHFQLRPAVAATQAPDAPLVKGAHCRFCDARKTICPLHNAPRPDARDEFEDLSNLSC